MCQNRSIFKFAANRFQWLFMGLLLFLAMSNTQVYGQIQLDHGSLDRAGLNALWFTSAELGAGGRIIDWAFNVDRSKVTSYIRLQAGPHLEIISENDLDGFGKPLGLDGLVEYAEFRKQVIEAELKSRGQTLEVKQEQYTLPKSTIYVLGSNSRITSIDADNGRQNWSVGFGSLSQPNIGVHADDNYVAAVNGTSLHCFEAATGKIMWSHPCRFAVEAPPVVAGGKIFVPLLDGRLEVFDVSKGGFGGQAVVATGVPSGRPLVTSRTVGWPTDMGYLNFTAIEGEMGTSLIYRLKASGRISSTPTLREALIFTGSEDGFVYAIREANGKLEWQTSIGTSVSQSPFTFGDRLYVISDDRRMYCMDAHTGEMKWAKAVEGIGRYLGASRQRIYVTDGFRSLLAVDPVSGTILNRADIGAVRSILPNNQTDRLYVASSAGVVHCIHETGHEIPYFHPNTLEALAAKGKTDLAENPFAEGEEDDAKEDPFKSDEADVDDPFKSEPKTEPKETEPKENDDPFSNDAEDKGAGEGDDPFSDGDDMKSDKEAGDKDTAKKTAPPTKKLVFWKDVAKVFSNNCVKCHGAENPKGGFDASSYESVMLRGEELVIAGDGEGSHLFRVVNHDDTPAMPPGGKKIPNGDLKKLKNWINDGALEKAEDATKGDDAESEDGAASGPDAGSDSGDVDDPFK